MAAATLEPNLRAETIEVEAIKEDLDLDGKAKFSIEKSVSCDGGCSKKKGMEHSAIPRSPASGAAPAQHAEDRKRRVPSPWAVIGSPACTAGRKLGG